MIDDSISHDIVGEEGDDAPLAAALRTDEVANIDLIPAGEFGRGSLRNGSHREHRFPGKRHSCLFRIYLHQFFPKECLDFLGVGPYYKGSLDLIKGSIDLINRRRKMLGNAKK